jgi:hypothetical protein
MIRNGELVGAKERGNINSAVCFPALIPPAEDADASAVEDPANVSNASRV